MTIAFMSQVARRPSEPGHTKKIMKLLIMSIAVWFAQDSPSLYEEEPVATLALREKLWRQMDSFAASLKDHPETRRQMLRVKLGYPPAALSAPGKPRLEKTGEDALATYYRCWIKVAPDLDQYGLYIVPKGLRRSAPLVISKHGGGGTPEMATFQGGSNYHDMVRGAVREGYVVWAPLTVMYPFRDRDQGPAIPAEVRRDLDARLREAGASLMGLEVAKMSRALDSLLAHRKEIDRSRIAMIGLSYGGFYTLYTAALDPRIKVAVASCSFRNEAAPRETGAPAGRPVDMAGPELISLIAPRPIQVQAGINDKGFPIEDVRRAAARTRELLSKTKPNSENAFEFIEFPGGHEWRGEVAWPFLRKHLR
jgi:dienelactone hydrolase